MGLEGRFSARCSRPLSSVGCLAELLQRHGSRKRLKQGRIFSETARVERMRLSCLAPPPAAASPPQQILDTKVDSPELLSSFGTLAEVHPENSVAARRGLRATVERRGLAIHREFLQGAQAVVDALAAVQAELDGLGAACDGIAGGLEAHKAATAGLLGQTDALAASLAASQRRGQLVEQFLGSYQLAPEEVAALEEGEIAQPFFDALERVRTIHANCRALLHTHHQRAGLEIMDAMGGHQEAAYERLCRWVQSQCRALASDDAPEVDPTLAAATTALQQRPVLFKVRATPARANQRPPSSVPEPATHPAYTVHTL